MIINQTQTAIESYHQTKNSGEQKRQKELVYDSIRDYPSITDRQISELCKLPLVQARSRRNELMHEFMIVQDGEVFDAETKRNVSRWKINKEPGLPFLKVSNAQKLEMIKELCEKEGWKFNLDLEILKIISL